MDNFNLKKYLAEGKLVKEEVSSGARKFIQITSKKNKQRKFIESDLDQESVDKFFLVEWMSIADVID